MSLKRVNKLTSYPLVNALHSRQIEQALAGQLPPHTLMQRAGLAIAKLAIAIAPHAKTIWVVCGPGNNGGDGLEAAMHLHNWAVQNGRSNQTQTIVVTWLGDESRCPPDALASLQRARSAGVHFAEQAPEHCDLAIDALLGIGGGQKPLSEKMSQHLQHMHACAGSILCVDLPSGLDADTGRYAASASDTSIGKDNAINKIAPQAIYTPARGQKDHVFCLSLLTLKPGLFTAQGKDAAGQVWFDDLGASEEDCTIHASAWVLGADRLKRSQRAHDSHKGSFGDVAIVGGAEGMTGAALLSARASLHAGAGRVLVALLDGGSMRVDPAQPELMFRTVPAILDIKVLRQTTVVCGCGGGDAVRQVLPAVLSHAPRLVLDADALNAIAQDTSLQTLLQSRAQRKGLNTPYFQTILTPHPLEAARLLDCSAAHIQSNRLQAAQQLASRFACTVVLKGSGSIIAAPDEVPCINSTGNAKLATAGTGDVLAGMVAALLAQGVTAFQSACAATYLHGRVADDWPVDQALTASEMVKLSALLG